MGIRSHMLLYSTSDKVGSRSSYNQTCSVLLKGRRKAALFYSPVSCKRNQFELIDQFLLC